MKKDICRLLIAFYANEPQADAAYFHNKEIWENLLDVEKKANTDLMAECKLSQRGAYVDPWCSSGGEEEDNTTLIHQTVAAWLNNERLPTYNPKGMKKVEPCDEEESFLTCVGGGKYILEEHFLIDLAELKDFFLNKNITLPTSLFPGDNLNTQNLPPGRTPEEIAKNVKGNFKDKTAKQGQIDKQIAEAVDLVFTGEKRLSHTKLGKLLADGAAQSPETYISRAQRARNLKK